MNCPKCNAPLEMLYYDDEQTQPFRLRYGKKDEHAGQCSQGCWGMWTETSVRLWREMMERLEQKRFEKTN